MFEWQRASQDSTSVPHYKRLLEFLDLRAQASETCSLTQERRGGANIRKRTPRSQLMLEMYLNQQQIVSFVRHPLYACPKFKSLPHDKMWSAVRSNNVCLNCFRPGHMSRNCTSLYRCKRCQKPHHTLLHVEAKETGRNPRKPRKRAIMHCTLRQERVRTLL